MSRIIHTINQNKKFRKGTPSESQPDKVRFIIVGASIMYNVFYNTEQIVNMIKNNYSGANVIIHNHASPGETIGSYAKGSIPNITNTLSLYNNNNSSIKTYVIIHLGGNDRTNSGEWDTLSSAKKTQLNDDLDYILDTIEAKGFTPILNDLTFRDYDNISHDDEEHGILPYNRELIIPKILTRSHQFAFPDGQSYWQLYTRVYNNYETYLSSDNIHLTGTGYSAMKTAFVNTICKYIFTGVPPEKLVQNGHEPELDDNMEGEDDFLSAYLYPLSGYTLSGLQNALDTYDAVRLESGTYGNSSQTLYIDSNKKLYGVPNATVIPRLVVKEGAENVLVNGLRANGNLYFETGNPIKNSVFKNLHQTQIKATGASLENNKFINITGGSELNFSSTGYAVDNIFIKQWIHGSSPQIVFRGNNTTPSYGNIQIWLNNLTPGGDGNVYDNVKDVTIIGHDSEGWNLSSGSSKAMTEMRNMGDVKISDLGGGNGYSPLKTPPFDIEADNFYLFNSTLNNSDDSNRSKIITSTNMYMFNGTSRYDFDSDGFDLNLGRPSTATYNGSNLNSTLSSGTTLDNIKAILLPEEKEPLDRPDLPSIPNPTGNGWDSNRAGQTDSRNYIQGLIDSNGVASLPEGIFYIGSTLNLKGQNEGVQGSGTGKTVIVGLTDDFPLITYSDKNTNRKFVLSNLTLQGGHTGVKVQSSDGSQLMITGLVMRDVIFRNMTYGINWYRFFGVDNNFFDNVCFVDCDYGMYQEVDPDYVSGSANNMMYMDKNVFYRMQTINCGVGYSMLAKRANNLNSWVDCVFDGNGIAVDMTANNHPNFVNCDFKNHTGSYIIGRSPRIGLYNCDFSNNTTDSIFRTTQLNLEGCNLNDDIPLLVSVASNPVAAYIQNSIIEGDLGYYTEGIIANSTMSKNSGLNKLLVKIVSGSATTIIDETPTPYPQYLVKS